VKKKNGDLIADFHNIFNKCKNYYSLLLNVHRVSGVRQIEIHTAELLLPDACPFEVANAIGKLCGGFYLTDTMTNRASQKKIMSNDTQQKQKKSSRP
jgi:hypothetical protein